MVRIMSSRMVATTTTEMSSTAIPTVSRAIGPPNPYKYQWLRSPNTYYSYSAWYVTLSGAVDNYNDNYDVNSSYGCIYLDRLFQIPFKILVVKIAVQEFRPCVFCLLGWWRLRRRQLCIRFPRTHLLSPNTSTYGVCLVNPSGGGIGSFIGNINDSYGRIIAGHEQLLQCMDREVIWCRLL